MTKLNDYSHPAVALGRKEQIEVCRELDAIRATNNLMPWTESTLETVAEQIREAEDGLDGMSWDEINDE